jgi:hypothetical protein
MAKASKKHFGAGALGKGDGYGAVSGNVTFRKTLCCPTEINRYTQMSAGSMENGTKPSSGTIQSCTKRRYSRRAYQYALAARSLG